MKTTAGNLATVFLILLGSPAYARVDAVNALVKVRPTEQVPEAAAIRIEAAQNEFEPFQVIVHGGAAGATGVSATATGLTGPGGAAVDSAEIMLYRQGLYPVVVPSNTEGAVGPWPDPLIPDVDAYFSEKRNAFPFEVPAGESRGIWVEVFVPPGTPAGIYTGAIHLEGTGLDPADIAVELRVRDFDLPSTASLKSAFGVRWDVCSAHLGSYPACGDDGTERFSVLYGRAALDHRVSLESVIYYGPDGTDWSRFDAAYAPLFDGTAPTRLSGAKQTTIRLRTGDPAEMALWHDHFEQRGWLDRLFDYTCDEPPLGCAFSDIPPRAAAVHSAGIRTLVTTDIDEMTAEGLSDDIDIAVPIVNYMHDKGGQNRRADYDAFLAQGSEKELWMYQSCMSHGCGDGCVPTSNDYFTGWPSYMIDCSAVQNRAMQWLCFNFDLAGELYFETTYLLPTAWEDQCDFSGNGDGTLFYPGTPDRIGGSSHIPVESVRLKLIREGMEDFEYLKLLCDLGDCATARAEAGDLFPAPYLSADVSPEDLYAARSRIADRIEEILHPEPEDGGTDGGGEDGGGGDAPQDGTAPDSGTADGAAEDAGGGTDRRDGGSGFVEGSGCGCGSGSAAGSLALVALLLAWVSIRCRPVVLVLFALAACLGACGGGTVGSGPGDGQAADSSGDGGSDAEDGPVQDADAGGDVDGDAGLDAGADEGDEAGEPDAGTDAGYDAGYDAGDFGGLEVHRIEPKADRSNRLEVTLESSLAAETFTLDRVEKNGSEVGLPEHASLDPSTGVFVWTPTPSQVAFYVFSVTATDAGGGTEAITLLVEVTMPEICTEAGDACAFLREKWDAGEAAGHLRDWYYNCDGFHTRLNQDLFPQLDLMTTSGCDTEYGTYPDRVIIGNESCALTSGESWSSIPRLLMRWESYAQQVYEQYRNNDHYWYPEHRDHDEVDYFHGKVPTLSVSQGSSGSEMDEVKRFAYILAAFRPDAKRALVAAGLLMPTVQMIFRRSRAADDAEYLSGTAHPSAYDNASFTMEMIQMANGMAADSLPPMVQLEVVDETYDVVDGKQERWFTLPVSVCRIFRGPEYTKRITVSAEGSFDLNALPLTYHWTVLRGDPAHVRISPVDAAGAVVEIEIDYHPKAPIGATTRLSNLVEVGVFVHNGVYYSAPAFVTSYTLDNQDRVYDQDGNLVSQTPNDNYVYPPLL